MDALKLGFMETPKESGSGLLFGIREIEGD
jgi:hypothetical protein